jgi:hypothetical protein
MAKKLDNLKCKELEGVAADRYLIRGMINRRENIA